MRIFEIEEDDEDIVAAIKEHCQPFLKATKGNLMYRGIKRYDMSFIGKVRQDRRPMTSTQENHELMDEMLKEKGFAATRTNSIFCTGNREQAETYGALYVIFPIENFNFTWSPKIRDAYHAIVNYKYNLRTIKKINLNLYNKLLKKFMGFSYRQNDNLIKALNSNHEIMFQCNKYYAIRGDVYLKNEKEFEKLK